MRFWGVRPTLSDTMAAGAVAQSRHTLRFLVRGLGNRPEHEQRCSEWNALQEVVAQRGYIAWASGCHQPASALITPMSQSSTQGWDTVSLRSTCNHQSGGLEPFHAGHRDSGRGKYSQQPSHV
jgi:hypothetical protein